MTNMGVQITLPIVSGFDSEYWAVLDCHTAGGQLCIPLWRISEDTTRYRKAVGFAAMVIDIEGFPCDVRDVYIGGSISPLQRSAMSSYPFDGGNWTADDIKTSWIMDSLSVRNSGQEVQPSVVQTVMGRTARLAKYLGLCYLIYKAYGIFGPH